MDGFKIEGVNLEELQQSTYVVVTHGTIRGMYPVRQLRIRSMTSPTELFDS